MTSCDSRSAALDNAPAAAAICCVLALCSSLDAATCSIAAAKDSVPELSNVSRFVISATSEFAEVVARSMAVVHVSLPSTARSTATNDRAPCSVAAST